jgi:hypothetical protein
VKRYSAQELTSFLRALDDEIEDPLDVILIGGSAAALAYQATRTTLDIDTWNAPFEALAEEIDRAGRRSALPVPVEHAGVADAPYNFETRLELLEVPGVSKLRLRVPEKHDLVLMKTIRGYEHDLETAREIHLKHGLDLEVLVERYLEEMSHVVGDRQTLDLKFLALVERLFGESALARAERAVDRRGR